MRIDEILGLGKPSVSFEFFPPKSEAGFAALYQTIDELKPLSPSYVSVTYGAGGSTRAKTVELTTRIQNEIKAKQEKALAAATAEQNQITAPKQSSFSYGDSVTMAGGAKIDLSSNTITHTDGTIVDLKTGLKVNVTA